MGGIALELDLELVRWPHGADHFLETGVAITHAEVAELERDYDAILLGALGDSRVASNVHARDILLGLRFQLDLYINFRPVRLSVRQSQTPGGFRAAVIGPIRKPADGVVGPGVVTPELTPAARIIAGSM
ncbi:MAG: hypothetical protein H0X65_14440 [Gemmatimonadetes bacterium]|nr:hypothetical protein [Gemmatimonadota bacterium]